MKGGRGGGDGGGGGGGGGAEYPEKTPDNELQKMPHTKIQKLKVRTMT